MPRVRDDEFECVQHVWCSLFIQIDCHWAQEFRANTIARVLKSNSKHRVAPYCSLKNRNKNPPARGERRGGWGEVGYNFPIDMRDETKIICQICEHDLSLNHNIPGTPLMLSVFFF